MRRLPQGVAALVLLAGLGATPVAAAAPHKLRGVQRNFAGAAWTNPPPTGGFGANLRLDRARVADIGSGGYIAQTLWMATNGGTTPYGRNKRSPYIQVGITQGWRGTNTTRVYVAQRRANGTYTERATPPGSVKLGENRPVGVGFDVGGTALVSILHGKKIEFPGSGADYGSGSAFAGIESSSRRNSGGGKVKQLTWAVKPDKSVGGFFKWRLGDGSKQRSKLVHRGPGRAAWQDKDYEFTNRFGG